MTHVPPVLPPADPNQARVQVPDERFDWLCEKVQPKNSQPAFLEVCDIAGLVKGAAQVSGWGFEGLTLMYITAWSGGLSLGHF